MEPLSGGMKRRLTIARSLINEPELIILDEPTTGLDPQARHLLWERLYRLKQRGATLIITTHYMDEAEQLCDRLVVMDKAEIAAEGSPRELIERYATREVLELRFADAVRSSLDGRLDGLAERSRGAAGPAPAVRRRWRAGAGGGPRSPDPGGVGARPPRHAGGRLPAPDRADADRMTAATRVLQRNLLVYRRTYRGSVFSSFVTPLLYLTAMGLGLGQLVTRDVSSLPGGDYLSFLGPGIMAATCMQSAVFESTFPIMGKIMWRRNYEAMLATPIEVRHILGGELLWIGFRMVLISSVFLVVLTLFRIPTSFLALLAVPACVLLGVAFSAAIISFAATQQNDSGFAALFRFVINPLFLFSGTFFPLSTLPESLRWVEWIAAATPLYHGVALVRGAVLNDAGTLAGWPWHVAYLVTFASVFAVVAHRLLSRRLVK